MIKPAVSLFPGQVIADIFSIQDPAEVEYHNLDSRILSFGASFIQQIDLPLCNRTCTSHT